MDSIRITIQNKLNEIQDIDCGVPVPDGMVEADQTYFGYEIQESYIDSDFNKRYIMKVDLTGRLVRRDNPSQNTLQVLDEALEELKEKLKELNFKYSCNDISFQDGIRKILVKATARYYEENDTFIV